MREASLCKKLRNIEVLQEVLSAARQRSQLKYSQLREDDDLLNLTDAPDIVCEWRGCAHAHEHLVTQSCLTLCNPMDCSHQAPLSMGIL